MRIKNIVLIIIGFGCLGLGAVGAVVPFLPTVPFLLLAAICFAKSSERLNHWFRETKLYKNNLETFVCGKGMTAMTKIRVMMIVTVLLGFAFYLMDEVRIGRILLIGVWEFHILLIVFIIKTCSEEDAKAIAEEEQAAT